MFSYWLSCQLRDKTIEVVVMSPGPMDSGLAAQHVPLVLWPSFALMRELLYKPPEEAAKALLHLAIQREDFPTGCYMCIRSKKQLLPAISDQKVHSWLLKHTREALVEVKYKWDPE